MVWRCREFFFCQYFRFFSNFRSTSFCFAHFIFWGRFILRNKMLCPEDSSSGKWLDSPPPPPWPPLGPPPGPPPETPPGRFLGGQQRGLRHPYNTTDANDESASQTSRTRRQVGGLYIYGRPPPRLRPRKNTAEQRRTISKHLLR